MKFSKAEIEVAKRLRQSGLAWEPRVGHYVFDESGFCDHESPFQEGVYFILNHAYFMRLVGGVERFKEIMIWLPTWEDLRTILRDHGVSDQEVAEYLKQRGALEAEEERLALYEMVDFFLEQSRMTTISSLGI